MAVLGNSLPDSARFMTRLGRFSRFIRFDRRGMGLSDRDVTSMTLEERVDDIRAVMDAVGSEIAALLGVSEGGYMSLMFAATHPERTTALVLCRLLRQVQVGASSSGKHYKQGRAPNRAHPSGTAAGRSRQHVRADMKTVIIAVTACSMLAAPAYADRGRTGRGADADGDRITHHQPNRIQGKQDAGVAIVVLRALIEQLVQDGVLPPERALTILDRAKAISAAEAPTRESRSLHLLELDAIRESLTGVGARDEKTTW